MMKAKQRCLWSVLLIVSVLMIGCAEDKLSVLQLPRDPGPGNLAGIILGTVSEQPLSGVNVAVGAISTTTDNKGQFRLNGVGEGILGVVVRGGSIYTRTAAVNTATGRSVFLDAIETASDFHLGFYRELARGNHPDEADLFQTHRWVNPNTPTFYIDLDASATLDGVIDDETIQTARDVIATIVEPFTGGVYSSPSIQTQVFGALNDFGDIPDNSFVFVFDDTLYFDYDALGLTLTEPDFLSPSASTINKTVIFLLDSSLFYTFEGVPLDRVIAHESGHGFGFRHTSLLTSIMRSGALFVAFDGLFTDADRLHMRIMYRRPPGNTDIDNDPLPAAKRTGTPAGVQVHIDRLRNQPKLSSELFERAKSLRRHRIVQRYINK